MSLPYTAPALGLIAALALSACASNKDIQPMPQIMLEAAKSIVAKKPDTNAQRAEVQALTRKQFIGAGNTPMILVDIETTQQYATLAQIATNGAYDTYQSADRKSLTFTGGLLSASRGLGADLISLDNAQTQAALAAPSKDPVTTIRTHRYLNGEYQTVAVVFMCQLNNLGKEQVTSIHQNFSVLHFVENCRSEQDQPLQYTNSYWLDSKDKVMWKSRQWVGETIGYLGVDTILSQIRR